MMLKSNKSRQPVAKSVNRLNHRPSGGHKDTLGAKPASKVSSGMSSPEVRKGRDNNATISAGGHSSKAKSPLQCGEMVFGNLTNMELSARNSPSSQEEACKKKDELISTIFDSH